MGILNGLLFIFIFTSLWKVIYSNPASASLGVSFNINTIISYAVFAGLKEAVKKCKPLFEKVKKIASSFGNLIDATAKRYTLFFLLSYEKAERKIKIEISKRPLKSNFEVKNYLGIPVLVMKKEDMVAGKLSAFLTRKKFASRDLFDLWFFLKNDWDINEDFLKANTGFGLKKSLQTAVKKLNEVKPNQLLQGLGELLDEKQKSWVKNKLKKELLFYLKLKLKEIK